MRMKINIRKLKFKAKRTITFYATINHYGNGHLKAVSYNHDACKFYNALRKHLGENCSLSFRLFLSNQTTARVPDSSPNSDTRAHDTSCSLATKITGSLRY